MHYILRGLGLAALCLCFSATLYAQEKVLPDAPAHEGVRTSHTGTCSPGGAEARLNVNNVEARLFNNGNLFWRGSPHIYEVPKGGGVQAIFASGLWVGGTVDGSLRAAAARYGGYEFFPGPLNPGGTLPSPSDCSIYDRIYRIDQRDLDLYDSTGEATSNLLGWPTQLGAPVVDGDGNPNNYNLAGGDRPEVHGHQTYWWVMNDVGNVHPNTGTEPLGIEVQVTAFAALSTTPAVNDATLYRFRVINRNTSSIDNTLLGIFSDPDLGNFDDDYVGSDPARHLGFVYNADDDDEGGYGPGPPALGYRILNASPMTSFMNYINGSGVQGDATNGQEYYNYMNATWRDGQHVTHGGDGLNFSTTETDFMFPDDPTTGAFWSEMNLDNAGTVATPSDRRFVMGSAAGTLQPGASTDLLVGIVWARGSDNLDSVNQMKAASDELQSAWDAGFSFPVPQAPSTAPELASPDNNVTNQPRNVELSWQAVEGATEYQVEVWQQGRLSLVRDEIVFGTTFRVPDLDGNDTYRWRVRAANPGGYSPWSASWRFATGDVVFTAPEPAITNFFTVANGAGPLDPFEGAAPDWQGFPSTRPTANQQVGDGRWMIHTGGARATYAEFLSRSLRFPDNIGDHDYEWRFTGNSLALEAFTSGAAFEVPFELWDVGPDPNDTSDDVRLIPWIVEGAGGGTDNDAFDIMDDHIASGADNDPYSDWIYFRRPTDTTPGDAGYQQYVTDVNNGTYDFGGNEVFARMVLFNWNGGSAPPFNQDLPEFGTIFRIVTSKEPTPSPILASPADGTDALTLPVDLYWNGPLGAWFDVEVSTVADFSSLVAQATVAGQHYSFNVSAPHRNQTYHWRVRSVAAGKPPSAWTDGWSFSTGSSFLAEIRAQNPPIVIGSNGGRYRYRGRITNNGTAGASTQAWFDIINPGGTSIQVRGPFNLNLAAGGRKAFKAKQRIPGSAPAGTYLQRVYVGTFPGAVDGQAEFSWEKSASKAGGDAVNDWESEFAFDDEALSDDVLPTAYALSQNYPNPFNPTTLIQYALPEASQVSLRVYNMLGQEVSRLVDAQQSAGRYDVRFDASRLSAGMYVYVLQAADYREVRRMVLLK